MFTPKFNIGALVLIATKPPVEGTVTGFHNSDPAQEPFYCVRRSDTLEDNWYRECDLQHPQPTAQVGCVAAVELNGLSFFNFVTESPVDKAARELREAQDARNKAQAVVNDLADKLKAADNALKDANVLRDTKRKAYEAAANVPAGICDTRF